MRNRLLSAFARSGAPASAMRRAVVWAVLVGAGLCLVWAVNARCSDPVEAAGRPKELPVGRLAAVSDVTGRREVWVIDPGALTRPLTNIAAIPPVTVFDTAGHRRKDGTWKEWKVRRKSYASVNEVALSPDGRWVAYRLFNPNDGDQICVVRADGDGEPVVLTTDHGDFYPSWFPDSKRIAFARQREVDDRTVDDIYVVDREEKGPAQLLARLGDDWSIVRMACSPDGKTLILERFGPVPPEGGFVSRFHSIWSLDVESGKVSKLPLKGESFIRPAWFPDGSAIVYCALEKRESPWEIRKCRPDGSGEETLFSDPFYSPVDLTVSPDGRHVVFAQEDPRMFVYDQTLYVLEIATAKVYNLTPKQGVSWQSPSWGLLPGEPEEEHGQ